jgi:hypothetical protein
MLPLLLLLLLLLLMLSMIVDVDQQSQMIRHPAIGTCKTRTTAGTGTVLPRYGNVRPVPVPEHTHEHIITVLPVPVSCLTHPRFQRSCPPFSSIRPVVTCPQGHTIGGDANISPTLEHAHAIQSTVHIAGTRVPTSKQHRGGQQTRPWYYQLRIQSKCFEHRKLRHSTFSHMEWCV